MISAKIRSRVLRSHYPQKRLMMIEEKVQHWSIDKNLWYWKCYTMSNIFHWKGRERKKRHKFVTFFCPRPGNYSSSSINSITNAEKDGMWCQRARRNYSNIFFDQSIPNWLGIIGESLTVISLLLRYSDKRPIEKYISMSRLGVRKRSK